MDKIQNLIDNINFNSKIVNFDNAALSFLPKKSQDSISNFNERRTKYGPDYSEYWKKVEEVRWQIAKKINANEDEIFFIQNTSMGINFVANAIEIKRGDNVIITDLEFPSNVYPWFNLKKKGVEVRISKNTDGEYSVDQFNELIDKNTKAISISWVIASNGTVLDIKSIGKLCKSKGINFIVDGIQGLGALPIDVNNINCDFFISGFYKWMLGPDGLAFVYIKKELLEKLNIPWIGWAGMKDKFNYSQFKFEPVNKAKKFETGNMNFSAFYGLYETLKLTEGYEFLIYEKIKELTVYLRNNLMTNSNVELRSNCKTISGITLFKTDRDEIVKQRLKENRIAFSYRNGIRVSPHFYNSKKQIDVLLNCIK